MGSLLIFIFFLLTVFCCNLLLKAKNITNCKNYTKIGILAYGKLGEYSIAISIILNNYLLCIIYSIVFGKNIQNILEKGFEVDISTNFCLQKKYFVLVMSVIVSPFVYAKNTEKLKLSSVITMVGVALFCFACIFNFAKLQSSTTVQRPDIKYFPNSQTTPS